MEIALSPVAKRIQWAMDQYTLTTTTKMTWNKLASLINVTASAPSNWKRGKISNTTLKEIATVLGVNFSALLGSEEEDEAKNSEADLIAIGSAYLKLLKHKNKIKDLLKKMEGYYDTDNIGFSKETLLALNEAKDEFVFITHELELAQSILNDLTGENEACAKSV